MSTSVLKALPGKLDIKRHSPSILYVLGLMLVTGSYDSTIVVWDVENEMQKVKLQVNLKHFTHLTKRGVHHIDQSSMNSMPHV